VNEDIHGIYGCSGQTSYAFFLCVMPNLKTIKIVYLQAKPATSRTAAPEK
jgi:hypothetical protein